MERGAGETGIPGKRRPFGTILPLVGLAVWLLPAAPALAQQEGTRIELNQLEDIGSGCRVYLVLGNASGDRFSAFKIDLVLFDGKGVINERLAVDVAPARPRSGCLTSMAFPAARPDASWSTT